jgi:plasmid stabilization system protein ParE
LNKIQNVINPLADFPSIGKPLSAIYDDADDYRFLVCGKYLAFYHVLPDKVCIDRILYGKQDYIKILFGELPEEET